MEYNKFEPLSPYKVHVSKRQRTVTNLINDILRPHYLKPRAHNLPPQDQEILSYMLRFQTYSNCAPQPNNKPHDPSFTCLCIKCYTSILNRLSCSPQIDELETLLYLFHQFKEKELEKKNQDLKKNGGPGLKTPPEKGVAAVHQRNGATCKAQKFNRNAETVQGKNQKKNDKKIQDSPENQDSPEKDELGSKRLPESGVAAMSPFNCTARKALTYNMIAETFRGKNQKKNNQKIQESPGDQDCPEKDELREKRLPESGVTAVSRRNRTARKALKYNRNAETLQGKNQKKKDQKIQDSPGNQDCPEKDEPGVKILSESGVTAMSQGNGTKCNIV